jgi:ribosomal protein S18 acetylase RimI-like enzyme
MEPEYIERKDFLIGAEERTLHRREMEIIKELKNLNMTTEQVMLGKTPSIHYKWHTKNGNRVAEFKIWDWWDGKNISDLEISENYKGLGLSYQLLDYATKRCGARNLAVKKSNTIAKHVYDKYGFQVVDEDNAYYYMSLVDCNWTGNRSIEQEG